MTSHCLEIRERHKAPFPVEELISYEQIIKETMGDVVVEEAISP